MNVTSKISVDMTRQNVGQRVNAVQGDGNTRQVEIILLAGGDPWTPPEGVEAAIAYMQPGGTKGLYNKLADGTAAISISGNVATINLAPQMLTASGTVQASLVFNDQQLNRLTTFPFAVSVTSNPFAGAQKVEDYLRLQWLEDKLEEYLSAIKASGVFDGKPGYNGVTFTPSVSENGDLSWRNNGGLPNPQTVNILGPQGDSTAATAAANSAKTSAANAETHAAAAATSAAAAQEAVGAMGTELSQIKGDLSAEQTAREQADTSLQQEISGKLPKSPADWEPWTAEEQAAARERMGIPGDYELIEEITLTEDVSVINRKTYPDGTPYRLKSIIITAEIVSGESAVAGQIDNSSNVLGSFYVNAGKKGFFKFYGDVINYDLSLVDTKITTVAVHSANNTTINTTPRLTNSYNKLNEINVRCNAGVLPSGSVIKLYGVRA